MQIFLALKQTTNDDNSDTYYESLMAKSQ